jgi:hypothetical protein
MATLVPKVSRAILVRRELKGIPATRVTLVSRVSMEIQEQLVPRVIPEMMAYKATPGIRGYLAVIHTRTTFLQLLLKPIPALGIFAIITFRQHRRQRYL